MVSLSSRSVRAATIALGLTLLVALALRFNHIDTQSLWSDEGNSVAMAPRAIPEIVRRTAQDIHPPLYYMALHGWVLVFGTSEAAARGLSALFGTATVAMTAALGMRVGGRRVALFGALFAVHYSQEARMYAMVTFLGAASWLAWFEVVRGRGAAEPPRARVIAYLLVTLAMLYTHYYAVSLVVAQNLAWLWLWLRGRRVTWQGRAWIVAQLSLVLLYLPWLWYARRSILNWPAVSPEIPALAFFADLFRIFSVGVANEGLLAWSGVGFGVLLMAGLVAAVVGRGSPGRDRLSTPIQPLFYAGVPVLLMLALSLDRPFWNPKFLLIALPGYHLLLGQGADFLLRLAQRGGYRLAGAVATAIAAFALLAPMPSLYNEFHDPRYWRDDYRAIARTIAAREEAGDAILLDGPGQSEIFDYYYDGDLPLYLLPATRPINEPASEAQLEAIAAAHERLFAVWWAEQEGDPDLVIPRWLEQNTFEAGSRWYGAVRLATYRLGDLPSPQPLDVAFALPGEEGRLRLEGAAVEPVSVIAGEVLAINSQWSTDGSTPATFFAQLLDGANNIVGQYDGPGGAPSVADWDAGESYAVLMGLPVAVGAAPGTHRLIVGAYDPVTGQRFVTEEGDAYELGAVSVAVPVEPPAVEALALRPGEEQHASYGDLTLVGARANRLGHDHEPTTPLAAGEPVSLLLYWRAEVASPVFPALLIRMLDDRHHAVAEWSLEPLEGRYPPEQWRQGELARDPHIRFIPADVAAGRYRLLLEDGSTRTLIGEIVVH
jgi:mannosyltransferase